MENLEEACSRLGPSSKKSGSHLGQIIDSHYMIYRYLPDRADKLICTIKIKLQGGSRVICMILGMFPGLDLYCVRILHNISQREARTYIDDLDRDPFGV